MGDENLNPLEELKRLDQQVGLVASLEGLKANTERVLQQVRASERPAAPDPNTDAPWPVVMPSASRAAILAGSPS